jgi:hypothetical protein
VRNYSTVPLLRAGDGLSEVITAISFNPEAVDLQREQEVIRIERL